MSSRSVVLSLLAVFALTVSGWSQPQWILHLVSDEIYRIHSIRAVDFDLDGDLDFVTGNYHSNGCDWWEQTTQGFIQHPISYPDSYGHAEPVDIDQDGDIDVVACSHENNTMVIIENVDGEFVEYKIDDYAEGTYYAIAVDLDQNGDVDVLAAYEFAGEVVWLENRGGQFIRRLITNELIGPVRVAAGDMDNDGDLDVVISDYQDDKILVAYNFHQATEWVVEPALTNYNGAWNTSLIDINSDGRLDILTSAYHDDSIDWLENTVDGFVQNHLIDHSNSRDLQVVDVNNDGIFDLVSISPYTGLYWWESDGVEWTGHLVADYLGFPTYVVAEDIDGDGDIDLASVSYDMNMLIWYEQAGSPHTVSYQIIPTQPPYILPSIGGTVTYSGSLVNTTGATYPAEHKTWVELPNGNIYGPLSNNNLTITPFMEFTVNNMALDVPANAPAGTYQFIGRLILPDLTLEDGFPFHKQAGMVVSDGSITDWQASGWPAELGREEVVVSQPDEYQLHPAHPNPFNPVTTIRVTLPESAELSVVVFNTTGQQVATLAQGSHSAGTHTFEFAGQELSSAVYFVHAKAKEWNDIQKVVLMK